MPNVRFTPWSATRRHFDPAAGVATAVATGALAMALVVPQAATAASMLSSPVRLLSTSVQSAVDQLLDAQQHIIANNSTYPWVTPFDVTSQLHGYTQTLASTQLGIALTELTNNQFNALSQYQPFVQNAPGADPQPFFVITNPDVAYQLMPLDPGKTYEITVDPGPGSQDVNFTAYGGNGVSTPWSPTGVVASLSQATPNADGTYTLVLSSTQPPGTPAGNWLDITGAQTLVTRDTMGDWGLPHADISIHEEGFSPSFVLPMLSHDQISALLTNVANGMVIENGPGSTYHDQPALLASVPANHMTPIMPTGQTVPGLTLPDQLSSYGHFSLLEDQALVIKAPDVEAAYTSIQLTNGWGVDTPYATVQGSLNGVQAYHDPDGYVYYVISSQDTGFANWIDNSDLANGEFGIRWQGVTASSIPAGPVETHVVDVADLGQYLPADTPLVTPAERAADLQERLFNYDYANDQENAQGGGVNWLTTHLELDQIKAAMGADQYHEIFGGQTDVPSVLERLMSPALSPNMDAIANVFATDPDGAWSAMVNNLPLAFKDVMLPTVLAELRFDMLVAQTVQSVQGNIASGDWSQALASVGTGFQGFGTVFDDMWTDPTTSITAGFLNARNDLAVSIMHADSYSPLSSSDFTSVADQLSEFEQSVSQMLSAGSSAVSDLLS